MKLLIIEGWPASGKATLWSMLDGHEKIYVEPLHSYFYEVIFELFDDEHDNRKVDIRTLRKCLAGTEYYKYELYASLGSYEMTAGKDAKLTFKFDFNFRKFDRLLSNAISANVAPLTANSLLNLMLTCYFNCLDRNTTPSYFASMSNYFNYRSNNYKKFPSIVKVIQVQRDAAEIYASRLGRTGRPIDAEKNLNFAPTRLKMAKEAEIEEILAFDKFHLRQSQLSPEQYLQVSLTNLIYQKDKALHDICSFLKITFHDILKDGSRDGVRFESESFQLTKRMNDKLASTLTTRARLELFLRASIFGIHRKPVNILNLYSVIRFLYLKIRRLR